MREIIETLGSDHHVRNVVLRFDSLEAGFAALYSLRQGIVELRKKDKKTGGLAPLSQFVGLLPGLCL